MAKNILNCLERGMSGFSKGQKRIASYILENYDKAAFMTASRLGILAGVSESTVVRFASELGYDGYPSMQRALQDMIRSRLTSTQRIQAAGDMFQDVLPAVIQSDIDKLRQMLSHSNRSEFDRVVDKIMSCRHVYIHGIEKIFRGKGYIQRVPSAVVFYIQRVAADINVAVPVPLIVLHIKLRPHIKIYFPKTAVNMKPLDLISLKSPINRIGSLYLHTLHSLRNL